MNPSFVTTSEISTTGPSTLKDPGLLSASEKTKIESRIIMPSDKELRAVLLSDTESFDTSLSSRQKQALIALLLRKTNQAPQTIPLLMPATSKESMFKSIKSRTAALIEAQKAVRDDSATLPQELVGVSNTLNEALGYLHASRNCTTSSPSSAIHTCCSIY